MKTQTQLSLPLSRLDAECCPKGVPQDVWQDFVRVADDFRANGGKHWGARGVMEVVRYFGQVRRNNRPFKVNNNYQAAMSRAYMDMRQCWDFFEIRGNTALQKVAA